MIAKISPISDRVRKNHVLGVDEHQSHHRSREREIECERKRQSIVQCNRANRIAVKASTADSDWKYARRNSDSGHAESDN